MGNCSKDHIQQTLSQSGAKARSTKRILSQKEREW